MNNKYFDELTKQQSKILKGIAILFMIGLHLFNRVNLEGYYEPCIWVGNYPLIYYVSFLFDACVPIYCFCGGYAAYLSKDKSFKSQLNRLLKLLFNYWIVLVLTIIVGLVLKHPTIPGNIFDLLGNVFLYDISYVDAWWFIQTYVLLTLTSPVLIKLADKLNKYIACILFVVLYFITYYFRMINPIVTNYWIINIVINAFVLYGTSVFPYVIGMIFKKYSVISCIREKFASDINVMGVCIIFLCIILHAIVKSMIVAPFVAVIFIIGFSLIHFDGIIKKILLFFGDHSTNIWLVHMQFYIIFAKELVFCTDTVLGCLIILLFFSIISSFIIKQILKLLKNESGVNV